MNQIAVSVICNVYNHEKYIRDALNGFVMQKTNFPFEVLIHDDASTDHSADIIREYEAKYPEIIKPIYQTVNQYSQGISIGKTYQWPRAQGKYIALCEGDDYWTDPQKLQKQFDAMEAHPEVDICAHAVEQRMADTGEFVRLIAPKAGSTIIGVEDVIRGEGGYVATNSLFYRQEINQTIPQFRRQMALDYTLQIHGSLRGGMLYLKDCMAVYRWMAPGSWTARVQMNDTKRLAFNEKKQAMLKQLDLDTEGKYTQVIRKRILENEYEEFVRQHQWRSATQSKYKEFFSRLPAKDRFKARIEATFPWSYELKARLWAAIGKK